VDLNPRTVAIAMIRESTFRKQGGDSLPPLIADALALLFCVLGLAAGIAMAWLAS